MLSFIRKITEEKNMSVLSVNHEVLPLIKSGIDLKKRLIALNLSEYRNKLASFEKKHHLSTRQFLKKFQTGKLGDDAYLFDWLFAHKVCKQLSDELSLLKKVKL